jgi:rare lipoprotein A
LRCHQHGENTLKLKLNLLLVAMLGVLLVPATLTKVNAQSGIASIYTTAEGTKTASGRRLSNGALTAAHKSLKFGTKVRVTNKKNGRSVVVTITDRGPFVRGRVIDLTPAGARALGFNGLAPVTLAVAG